MSIYGTEFHKAHGSYEEEKMEKTPITKWWENNNGKNFVLPYPNGKSVVEAFSGSTKNVIKKGHIYPFGGNKASILIPEKFALNKENGIFYWLIFGRW